MTATPQEILDVPMRENDANASTIRAYLVALVREVWKEVDGFSGKRPFGNSGWQYEVYDALVTAGHVQGRTDEDGYLEECDTDAADALILTAIDALGEHSSNPRGAE